jgi:hypothetical protein
LFALWLWAEWKELVKDHNSMNRFESCQGRQKERIEYAFHKIIGIILHSEIDR